MTDSSEETGHSEEKHDQTADMPITGHRFARRRGDIHEPEEGAMLWLLTFTDVMALMLTFFVLLFSMTVPSKEEWSKITSALQAEFSKFYGEVSHRGPEDSINIARIDFDRALNITYLTALLQSVTEESKYLKNVELISRPGSLIISLPRDLLFVPGSATVKEDGARALYALGGSLSRIKNKIEIAGNADPRPVTAGEGRFDSNWDLSLARAANVAAILEKVGYGNDVTIRGNSSGRYLDLKNVVDDEDKRRELARRVDIIVLDHDGNKQKVFFDPGSK